MGASLRSKLSILLSFVAIVTVVSGFAITFGRMPLRPRRKLLLLRPTGSTARLEISVVRKWLTPMQYLITTLDMMSRHSSTIPTSLVRATVCNIPSSCPRTPLRQIRCSEENPTISN